MCVLKGAQHEIRSVEREAAQSVLPDHEGGRVEEHVPRIPVRLGDPMHRVFCSPHLGRIGEKPLRAMLALPPEVLAQL